MTNTWRIWLYFMIEMGPFRPNGPETSTCFRLASTFRSRSSPFFTCQKSVKSTKAGARHSAMSSPIWDYKLHQTIATTVGGLNAAAAARCSSTGKAHAEPTRPYRPKPGHRQVGNGERKGCGALHERGQTTTSRCTRPNPASIPHRQPEDGPLTSQRP